MSLKATYLKGDHAKSKFFKNQSCLVLGCSGLGGIWRPIEEKVAVGTMMFALENGIRVFDTAPSYNKSQYSLRQALKQWSGETPFISTKEGRIRADRADQCIVDYSPETMRKSVYESLDI